MSHFRYRKGCFRYIDILRWQFWDIIVSNFGAWKYPLDSTYNVEIIWWNNDRRVQQPYVLIWLHWPFSLLTQMPTCSDIKSRDTPSSRSLASVSTLYSTIWSWYTGRWWVGCYIWYSDEGTGRAQYQSVTVLLYNGPLLCGFNVPIKGRAIGNSRSET